MNNDIDLTALSALVAPAAQAAAHSASTAAASLQRIEGATPGCYALMITDTAYHRDYPGASSTALKKLLRSPAHYQAYLKAPDVDSEARRFGRAVHALLLERPLFLEKFAVWADGRRAGKKYDEFCALQAGKTILNESEYNRAMEAALALRQCPDFPLFGDWLDGAGANGTAESVPPARTEFSIFWQETVGEGEEAGVVQCKARVDAHSPPPHRISVDVKTTDDVREEAFMHQFMRLDYDLQAAHYCAGLRAFYGEEYQFLFAAVESQEPFATRIFEIEKDVFLNGRRKRNMALARLLECQRTNTWPSYPAGIRTLRLRPFDRFPDQE